MKNGNSLFPLTIYLNMVLVFLSFKYGLKRFLKHEQLRWITTGERKVKLFKRREGSDGGHITSGRTWPYTLPYDEWKVTTETTESSQENFIGPIITTYIYVVTRFSLMGLINLYPGRASIDFYIAIIVCNSSWNFYRIVLSSQCLSSSTTVTLYTFHHILTPKFWRKQIHNS